MACAAEREAVLAAAPGDGPADAASSQGDTMAASSGADFNIPKHSMRNVQSSSL
jgi:hypothetical protein